MNALVFLSQRIDINVSKQIKSSLSELSSCFQHIEIETSETAIINKCVTDNTVTYSYIVGYVTRKSEIQTLTEVAKQISGSELILVTDNENAHQVITQQLPQVTLLINTTQLIQYIQHELIQHNLIHEEPIEPPTFTYEVENIIEIEAERRPKVPTSKTQTSDQETIELQSDDKNVNFIDISEEILANESEVEYDENPIYTRTRQIQKNLFTQQQWDEHKVIGVWSPIGRVGVSTFTLNFALFLAQNRIYTTVLEGLTTKPSMKQTLLRYTKQPKDWVSFATTLNDDKYDPRMASWIYNNVVFLPCTKDDLKYTWNPMLIEAYMTTSKIVDVSLVDLPSGLLQEYSKDSLNYLDELWILFDDSYHDLLNFKQYIKELEKKYNLVIHLIMSKSYEFSQGTKISKEMDLPLITSIPAMDELTMKNQYQNKPLFEVEEAKELLEKPYLNIANHLFSEPFKPIKSEVPSTKPTNLFQKIYTSFLKA